MSTFHYVYILQSVPHPNHFYTGLTDDLPARLAKHNEAGNPSTASNRPWTIKNAVAFRDQVKAAAFERYLKSPSGRAFVDRAPASANRSRLVDAGAGDIHDIQVKIDLPDAPVNAAGLTPEEARLHVAFSLYHEGRLSTQQCAELAGLPRLAFMDELARHRIEAPYTVQDAEADWANLNEARRR